MLLMHVLALTNC